MSDMPTVRYLVRKSRLLEPGKALEDSQRPHPVRICGPDVVVESIANHQRLFRVAPRMRQGCREYTGVGFGDAVLVGRDNEGKSAL